MRRGLVTVALLLGGDAFGIDSTWITPAGNWNVSTNWSPAGVPNNSTASTYSVFIDGGSGANSVVTLNMISTVNNLYIDAGDQLRINNNQALTIDGSLGGQITNAGTMYFLGGANMTALKPKNQVTLRGNGLIVMSNSANNRIEGNPGTTNLFINEDNEIRGAGNIGFNQMGIVNRDIMEAIYSTSLTLDPDVNGFINSGILRASAGRTMVLSGGNYTNFEGVTSGLIQASNGTMDVNSANIWGGNMEVVGTGTLDIATTVISGGNVKNSTQGRVLVTGNSTIDGVVNNPAGGQVTINGGFSLGLSSATPFTNAGTVFINATSGNTTLLVTNHHLTLTGGGIVDLSNHANNRFMAATNIPLRVTNENNTIRGTGSVGLNTMSLINRGTVMSYRTNTLTIDTAGSGFLLNSGLLLATNKSTLVIIDSGVVTNYEGVTLGRIEANAGLVRVQGTTVEGGLFNIMGSSTVELNNARLNSIVLTNSSSGLIRALGGASTINGGINNMAGGSVTVNATLTNNGIFYNAGAVNIVDSYTLRLNSLDVMTNAGTISISAAANNTYLTFGSNVAIRGGGVIDMGNDGQNYFIGAHTNIQVVNEDNTIQGAGYLGNNLMNIVNRSTIAANKSVELILNPISWMVNSGLILVTNSSMTILGPAITNYEGGTDGVIEVKNGTLTLDTVALEAGRVSVVGVSTVELDTTTMNNVVLTNSASGLIRALGGASTINGGVNNMAGGSVVVNATLTNNGIFYNAGPVSINNGALLRLNSLDVMTNAGTISISASANNTYLTIGSNVTIRGGGLIDMGNDAQNYFIGAHTNIQVVNEDNTIQGAGYLGNNLMNIVNRSTIAANKSAELILNPISWMVNSGLILVTNSSMTILGPAITNYEGGTDGVIEVKNGTLTFDTVMLEAGRVSVVGVSTVELDTTTMNNIVLTNTAGGLIRALGGASTINGGIDNTAGGGVSVQSAFTVQGVFQNAGPVNIKDTRTLTLNLTQAFTNSGTISLEASSSGTTLSLANDATLTGGGIVDLSNDAENYITATNSGYLLINENNTIRGSGSMGNNTMGFINRGSIEANQSVALIVDPSSADMINSGVMRANPGRTLRLNGANYTNYEGSTMGLIQADNGTLDLNSAMIFGGNVLLVGTGKMDLATSSITEGSVSNSTQGVITISGSSTVGGKIFNPSGGLITVNDGRTLTLSPSSPITNAGTISINASAALTYLSLANDATLVGGGIIQLSNDSLNCITGTPSSVWLHNLDNTIQGGGDIHVALTNNGTVRANTAASLDLVGMAKVNHGLFDVTAGGTLNVSVDVSGNGSWQADSGKIQLNSGVSVTTTGNITVAGSGELELNTATLYGNNLSLASASILDVNNAASKLSLSGDLTFDSTTEANWSWAAGSDMEFTGGQGASTLNWNPWGKIEIGGVDDGHVGPRFTNNFEFSELVIGANSHVYLQDLVDNANRTGSVTTKEALYVNVLTFADTNGVINKNGLNLYYNTLNGDTNQIIDIDTQDDDTGVPIFMDFVIRGTNGPAILKVAELFNGGWSITGRIQDVGSGININGNTTSDPNNNISPFFKVWNSTGMIIIDNEVFTNRPVDGGGMGSPAALGNDIVTNKIPMNWLPVGVYTALLTAADNDEDNPTDRSVNNDFIMTFNVVDDLPALDVFPLNLNYAAMVGSSPAPQTFLVTNIGAGTLSYTNYIAYGGPGGWLTVNPLSFNLGAGLSQTHTAAVNVAGLGGGTYTATNTVNGNQTNSAKLISISLTLTNVPAPVSVSATAAGSELVRLAWTEGAGRPVLIVYRQGSAPTADPMNNTSYGIGAGIGGGAVIFNGTGNFREHVIAGGQTHYYRFYAVNNNHYSPFVEVSATTPFLTPNIIWEPFSYTNGVLLGGLWGGPNGWTNSWMVNNIGPGDFTIVSNELPVMTYYPTNEGNQVRMDDHGNSGRGSARRHFQPINIGTIYAATMISYEFSGPNKYAGMSFMSNDSERAFFGEIETQDRKLGWSKFGAGDVASGFNLNDFASNTNNTYLIVGAYNFDTRELKTKAYNRMDSVPRAEPAAWDLVVTANVGQISWINGVQISGGSVDGTATVGRVFFDEVRVGRSWEDVMLQTPISVVTTSFVVNGGVAVSDGQVTGGTFSVAMQFYHPEGVEITNTAPPFLAPNYDIQNAGFQNILTDRSFGSVTHVGNGTVAAASDPSHPGASSANVDLGTYTIRWTAFASNAVGKLDSTTLSNNNLTTFNVIDDDTNSPEVVDISITGSVSRPLQISLGGTSLTEAVRLPNDNAASNSIIYQITDGELAGVNASNPFRLWFGARDAISGLARSGGPTNVLNSDISLGNIVTHNEANFSAAESTPSTTGASATNIWKWTGAFSPSEIENLFTSVTAGSNGLNMVKASLLDADGDRSNDQTLQQPDYQYGFLSVSDDDTLAPVTRTNSPSFTGPALEIYDGGFGGTAIWVQDLNSPANVGNRDKQQYVITDGRLAAQSPGSPFILRLWTYDDFSGLSLGTDPLTNVALTLGTTIVSNGVNYSAANSQTDVALTKVDASSTQTWIFTSFNTNTVGNFYDAAGHSNRITFGVVDADNDRSNDRARSNIDMGSLIVVDDDAAGPTLPGTVGFDPFVDGTRFDGSDLYDMGWYLLNPNMGASVVNDWSGIGDGNVLSVIATNAGNVACPGGGTLSLLNNDDTISVSFNVKILNPQNRSSGFRVGFYNNNGTTVTNDLSFAANNDEGYFFSLATGIDTGISLSAETGLNGSIMLGTDTAVLNQFTGYNFNESMSHFVEMIFTKQPAGVNIEVYIDSMLEVSAQDNTPPYYTNFNEVAFGLEQIMEYRFDNLAVAKSTLVVNQADWTNNPNFTLRWSTNNVFDLSGVATYKATTNSQIPVSINDGISLGLVTQANIQITAEGVVGNYFFALDTDGDRPNDQARGNYVKFTTKYDGTPPLKVTNLVADLGPDDTSEIQLSWNPLPNGGNRQGDNAPLSPWRSYRIYYTDAPTGPTLTNNYFDYANGPLSLATNITGTVVLSNFTFDATYRLTVVGMDQAGNFSPVSDTVTVTLASFAVTQGQAAAVSAVDIAWLGSTNRNYDIIYTDAPGFGDNLSNSWQLMDTVLGSWASDTGSVTRVAPHLLSNTMRFYRVANSGAWQTNNTPRRASREVYAAKPITLRPGENWYSLFAIPDTATVAQVFGLNRLPSGQTIGAATKISWYGKTSSPTATNVIWLSTNGWIRSVGGSGPADDMLVPLNNAFNLELPPGAPTQSLVLVGRVPTNIVIQTLQPSGAYNLVSCTVPRKMTISELNLKPAGFTGGPNQLNSDEIRILNNDAGAGSLNSPKMRIWYRTSDQMYRYYSASYGSGDAGGYTVEPDDVIVVYTRKSTQPITWTNALHYTPPGKNINP